jgi:hypothetical protein
VSAVLAVAWPHPADVKPRTHRPAAPDAPCHGRSLLPSCPSRAAFASVQCSLHLPCRAGRAPFPSSVTFTGPAARPGRRGCPLDRHGMGSIWKARTPTRPGLPSSWSRACRHGSSRPPFIRVTHARRHSRRSLPLITLASSASASAPARIYRLADADAYAPVRPLYPPAGSNTAHDALDSAIPVPEC